MFLKHTLKKNIKKDLFFFYFRKKYLKRRFLLLVVRGGNCQEIMKSNVAHVFITVMRKWLQKI